LLLNFVFSFLEPASASNTLADLRRLGDMDKLYHRTTSYGFVGETVEPTIRSFFSKKRKASRVPSLHLYTAHNPTFRRVSVVAVVVRITTWETEATI
jgi:hypothetical protein